MRKQIVLAVVFVHVGVLLFAGLHDAFTRPEHRRKPIAVRLVKPAAPMPQVAVAQKPKAAESKKSAVAAPAPVAKKGKKAAKAPEKTSEGAETMLASIAQRLKDLESQPQVAKKAWTVPSQIDVPQPIVSEVSASSLSYGDALTVFLQEVLEFPEQGEVRAKLTLDAQGHLLQVEVLQARSEKNRDYLKNRLPELEYPCFNERTLKSREFTITFRNEDRR